jgi:5-methylcytosine-specific restriction endonuclease McrA
MLPAALTNQNKTSVPMAATKVKRRCPHCGGGFEVKPSRLRNGRGRFCSVSCARRGRDLPPRERAESTCEVCGVRFPAPPSKRRKYCSLDCRSVAFARAGNPNYSHGQSHTPAYRVQCTATRDARKRDAEGSYTLRDVRRLLHRQRHKCFGCGACIRDEPQIDHIHPLSRGGRNTCGNIQALCRPCNSSKHTRYFSEWRYRHAIR